jgi:hypothetical protein
MEGQKLWRLGGACAMLAGVLYLAVLPVSVVPLAVTGASPEAMFEAGPFYALVDRIPLPFLLGGLGFGLAAILALALVPALGALVETSSPAVVRWMGAIAYLGLAVSAVSAIHGADLSVRIASTYASGDPAIRAAIVALYPPATLTFDTWGLLQFGGVGIWIVVVCQLARRHALLPSRLAYLGIGVGVLYWFDVVGEILKNDALSGIGSGLGVVAGGVWYLWIGRTLWRRADQRGVTPGGG